MFETRTFRLFHVERPSPTDVLGWIEAGRAQLHVPLSHRGLRIGPFVWNLDTSAVVDLAIDGGTIDPASSHGRLEPPVRLPLGLEVQRIRISPDGDMLLGIPGLPDVNLTSVIPWLPRVPSRLRDLGRRRSAPRRQAPSALRVRATEIRPAGGALVELGSAGRLELSPSSRLDIHYDDGELQVHGRLDLVGGRLAGPDFDATGIRSTAEVNWHRGQHMQLRNLEVKAETLTWRHAHDWHLEHAILTSDEVDFARTGRNEHTVRGRLAVQGVAVSGGPGVSEVGPVRIEVDLDGRGIDRVHLDYHRSPQP